MKLPVQIGGVNKGEDGAGGSILVFPSPPPFFVFFSFLFFFFFFLLLHLLLNCHVILVRYDRKQCHDIYDQD